MNGWDLMTYFSSVGLGLSAVVIFGYFLRDARGLINPPEQEPEPEQDED